MKKMFISLAVASASLLYSQIANADNELSKEQAINVLSSAVVDIHKYEKEMEEMYKICHDMERVSTYSYKETTKEQLLNDYNNNLKDIKNITQKKYVINNKEVELFNENSMYNVKLSHVPGDYLAITTIILNYPEFPEMPTFDEVKIMDIRESADRGLQNSWGLESEYEQTLDILKNSYEKPLLEGNTPLDTNNKEEVENMLVEQVKGLNQILDREYQNKNFAFQALNDTNTKFSRNSLNIRYKLNRESMKRTVDHDYYRNISLINGQAKWQPQYTVVDYDYSYLNIDIPELKEKKLELHDIESVLFSATYGLETSENAKEEYKETLFQIKETEKARNYYVSLLKEMGSSKIPSVTEKPNFNAPEQNKKEAEELTDKLVSGINVMEDTIKELKSIAYSVYTTNDKEVDEKQIEKFSYLRYNLYFSMQVVKYNTVYLLDEDKKLNFYFDESNVSRPSFILETNDFTNNNINYSQATPHSNPRQSYHDLSTGYIEETLKQIKEEEKLVNNYKKYVLQVQSELNGTSLDDKTEVYNQKITLFEKLPLYRSADVSTKTNATVSPQTVNAFEKKGDWIRIKSYLGDVYIKPTFYLEGKKEVVETKIETLKRLYLHDLPASDSVSNATVAPQNLYALYKVGDWYAINTWLGVKFVKPDFVEEEYNAYLTSTERLSLYNEPSLDSINGGTLSPQTLKILKRKGEFLQVQTWMGPKYIKPTKDAPGRISDVTKQVELTKRVSLHTLPGSDYATAQSLAPQKINVVGELSNGSGWTLIHTWLGNRWVNL